MARYVLSDTMRGLILYFRKSGLLVLLALMATNACAEPSVTLLEQSPSATLFEPYSLTIEMNWEGGPDAFMAIPPSLDLSPWAEVTDIASSSEVQGERSVIRHTVTLLPKESGRFTIPEIGVQYLAKADIPDDSPVEEGAAPLVYPSLMVGPIDVQVNEPSDGLLMLMSFLVLGIVLFGSALVFYRRNAIQIANSGESVELTIPSFIHEARKHRLDDDHYAFYQSLAEASNLLHDSDTRRTLKKQFADLALAVGFKGHKVSEDDLDGAMRELERAARQDTNVNHND